MSPAVRFVNVSRRFGSIRAVDGVTLDIAEGEFFAMLGPSGSGKTTCLRLIAGFEQPDEGHIEIFGETAEGVPPYKRNVNTVFQDYALFPHMTVGENVAYGLRIKGVGRADREAKARNALAMVKLAGYEDRRPAQLSGGQRQRVALSRALVNGPKVLLLDEPLGALDLKLREQMQEELKALQKELGITFVFVTHDQGEALSMANRVAVFNEGTIIQVGSLFALLLQSFYSLDDYSGLVVHQFTLSTYAQLLEQANLQIILRTVTMSALVTLACAVIAFPIAYYAARYARGWTKALFYLAVMMPLWSSYLVKIYAWKLILAKEGILTWMAKGLHLSWLLDGILGLPVIGGPSLSFSYIGTFLVFVYIWIPYMILPIQAALERVPANYIEASADLGAEPRQTFWTVILPLALPGIIAGSIFTFSLTLGDYIVPTIVGNSRLFIGMAVYTLQGTAGNVPLAAAFTVVPMAIMGVYLWMAKRMGAFDVL